MFGYLEQSISFEWKKKKLRKKNSEKITHFDCSVQFTLYTYQIVLAFVC